MVKKWNLLNFVAVVENKWIWAQCLITESIFNTKISLKHWDVCGFENGHFESVSLSLIEIIGTFINDVTLLPIMDDGVFAFSVSARSKFTVEMKYPISQDIICIMTELKS